MDGTSNRRDLLKITDDISDLLKCAGNVPGLSRDTLSEWNDIVRHTRRQLREEILRTAVVGSIKSGKSTFVNALLGRDITKRGAGVITSIVTRIRPGKTSRANLYMKSWETVNNDIRHAAGMLPDMARDSDPQPLDLRNDEHRMILKNAVERLGINAPDGHRLPAGAIIEAYLSGYDQVREMIGETEQSHQFEADRFKSHFAFTGDDSRSIFLKDVLIEVPTSELDTHVEIADCQGSDSPNPLHLTRIQNYLVLAHLIIYVISSRTGLREADIRLLSMIRNMGIADNTLFVINCDFSEHADLADLTRLVDRTKQELSRLKIKSEVTVFSCLYHLFQTLAPELSEKDGDRMAQWEKDTKFTDYSNAQSRRFKKAFYYHLTRRRENLLFVNHLARLQVVMGNLSHLTQISRQLLTRDAESVKRFAGKLADQQDRLSRLSRMIKDTLDGSARTLKKTLRKDVDRLFDTRDGIVGEVIRFLRSYEPSYSPAISEEKFSTALYAVSQEFRQALDTRMAETVNPAISQFCLGIEDKIQNGFQGTAEPVDAMVRGHLAEYGNTLNEFGISDISPSGMPFPVTDFDSLKRREKLRLPPAQSILEYSTRMRAEATLRLGTYKMINFVKRVFKRPPRDAEAEKMRALKTCVIRIKKDTEKAVLSHFLNFRENLKFQYVFNLTDAAAGHIHRALLNRFHTYGSDLGSALSQINDQAVDKKEVLGNLDSTEKTVESISEKIQAVRARIPG